MGTAINAIKSHILNRYFKGGTTSGSFNTMTAGFDALMLAGVPDSYAENRANGNGVISSALSSVGEFTINASTRDRCTCGGCVQGSAAVRKRYCQNAT